MSRCIFTLLLSLGALQAQSVTGDWHGTLETGAQDLHLALHISGDAKTGLKATMDSLDQGAMAIPVSSISLTGSTLKFEIEKIGGSYEGKVDGDSASITGTWKQRGGELPLKLLRGPAEAPVEKKRTPKPSDIDGEWKGALEAGGQTLHLVLHIVNYEDGLSATMDSPDQNAAGMPVTSITRNGNKLNFEMKTISGSFEGSLTPDLTSLSGTWTQAGNSTPLVLKREK